MGILYGFLMMGITLMMMGINFNFTIGYYSWDMIRI
jgi:hypothetical protein